MTPCARDRQPADGVLLDTRWISPYRDVQRWNVNNLSALLLVISICLMAGCMTATSTTPGLTPVYADEPSERLAVVRVIDGSKYQPWKMTRADAFTAFGTPRTIFYSNTSFDAGSKVADGYHVFQGISALIQGDRVRELTIISAHYYLSNDMTIGTEIQKVKQVLGEPASVHAGAQKSFHTYNLKDVDFAYYLSIEYDGHGRIIEINMGYR